VEAENFTYTQLQTSRRLGGIVQECTYRVTYTCSILYPNVTVDRGPTVSFLLVGE
jgi:hypothetical protein